MCNTCIKCFFCILSTAGETVGGVSIMSLSMELLCFSTKHHKLVKK